MTANEFVRRIQTKVSMLSTGDIPIKLNGKDIECVVELIENGKGYYINIKQPTKDLALTGDDIKFIIDKYSELPIQYSPRLFEEILKQFNEQREKK